jgi:hypothetical protein
VALALGGTRIVKALRRVDHGDVGFHAQSLM